MKLRIDPVGKERVVFFNYAKGESPLRIRPDVILIRPNETPLSHFFSGRFWENLGILTLATHLEQNGVKFGVLEASLFQVPRQGTVALAAKYAPRFVGISVFSTDLLDEALQIAAGIKRARSDIVTVLGGHGASFVHQEILDDNPAVDAVIRGEGEKSLAALIGAAGPDEWQTVPNLAFRFNGEVVANPMAPADRNLDETPLPHRFVRDIMSTDAVLSKSPLMIVSSKGCFDRCAFCTITRFYSNTWRGRSPKHVVDELEFIVRRYDRRSIHFWDDTFIGPGSRGRNRAIEFAAEVRRRNLDITFHVTTRPSDLREDVIAALAAAGMRSIFIGVESADQAVLDYFGKHAKVDHATAAIELLWKHGVHRILAGFILFHPRMTFDSLRWDLDYLDSFPTVEISRIISRLSYYPGAQFWLENKAQLGPDSYKRYVMPPLADERLERLYRSCLAFHSHTVSIEGIFVCLEEQYLHDTAIIDIIAACRRRLFRLISARVRVVAEGIEQGRREEEEEVRFREEIYRETLEVIDTLVNEIGGAYLELTLKAYRLENHAKFLRVPRAARRKRPAVAGGSPLVHAVG